jgi:rubredoxin
MPESISNISAPQQFVGPQDPIPTDLIPLPSEGKVYPPGTPLAGLTSLTIRSMTAREEDILTSRALLRSGKIVSALLRSCITDKTIDVDNMLVGDRNAALIGIRITGYGAEYPIKITCPGCMTESQQEIDLGNLPLRRFPDDVTVTPGVNEFSVMLPVSKKRATFKLLTGVEEIELMQLMERGRKAGGAEELVTTRLKTQVISLGDEKDPQKLSNMIRNLPARDSRELRKAIEHTTPGVDLKTKFTCPNCGHQGEVEVPLGTDFFWPEA